MSDLSAELLGLEVESWSLAVSPEFCRQHDRHTIKRQEVIYGGDGSSRISQFHACLSQRLPADETWTRSQYLFVH